MIRYLCCKVPCHSAFVQKSCSWLLSVAWNHMETQTRRFHNSRLGEERKVLQLCVPTLSQQFLYRPASMATWRRVESSERDRKRRVL